MSRAVLVLLFFLASDLAVSLAGLELVVEGNHAGGVCLMFAGFTRICGKAVGLRLCPPEGDPQGPKKNA